MPLNGSGQISIGGSTAGQSINLELGRSATATSNLNETALRTLAGVPSGAISLSNFYGKSNFTPVSRTFTTGTSDTVPTGATQVRIRIVAGGGNSEAGGGFGSEVIGAGGGGGGGREFTIAVTGGNSISFSIGGAQTQTTASGTVSGGSFSMTASPGSGTSPGGTGSGNGTGYSGGSGGAGGFQGDGTGGDSAAALNSWTEITGRGAGGSGSENTTPAAGIGGGVHLYYT